MKLILLFILIISFSFISSTEQSEELIIYDLFHTNNTGIIMLTDNYSYSDHPDSSVIAKKYLSEQIDNEYNYHKLDSKHRKRFLDAINIKETDVIYVYDLVQNSVFAFNVKDINLVASLTPYDNPTPLQQRDFVVSFELEKTEVNLLSERSDFFVYVGKQNPFREGEAKSMIWKEIDATLFPNFSTDNKELKKILSSSNNKTHTYHQTINGLNYFLKDVNDFRIVLVTDSIGTVIFTELFSESEGCYLTPLFTKKQADKGEYYINQWTGNIFKSKPSILFGFESLSFGCSSISFIDKKTPNLRIRCDNRH